MPQVFALRCSTVSSKTSLSLQCLKLGRFRFAPNYKLYNKLWNIFMSGSQRHKHHHQRKCTATRTLNLKDAQINSQQPQQCGSRKEIKPITCIACYQIKSFSVHSNLSLSTTLHFLLWHQLPIRDGSRASQSQFTMFSYIPHNGWTQKNHSHTVNV